MVLVVRKTHSASWAQMFYLEVGVYLREDQIIIITL